MVELYKFQQKAVNEMKNGCILCGGVGSGKSRTALTYYIFKACKGSRPIKGTSLKYNAMKEPHHLYILTTARKRDTEEWEEECLPFEIERDGPAIKIDSWNNIRKYRDVKDAFFIFDEDRVTGYGTWAKTFIHIAKENKWIILSATPGDTWLDYMSVFIANGYFKNKTEFIRNHVVYSRFSKYPKVDHYIGVKKLEALRNDILIDMDFRRPTESHHIDIPVAYDRDKYKDIMKRRWNVYEDEPIENISQLCYLIRKVTNEHPSRIEAIKQIINVKHRAIIFYNFNYELELLKSMELDDIFEVAEWNGHKHESIPKGKYWLYLVQYTAGAEGWNCITTDTMIFYSQNYSYKVMAQAQGRIDRLNTPYHDLYFYHLRSKAPIDLAISRALRKKQKFNEKRYFKVK